EGAAQAVLGGAVRRGREGPPGRVQHAPADPGGRAPDRFPGPGRRLQEHRAHHDVEPRHPGHLQGLQPGLPEGRRHAGCLRADEDQGAGRAQAALPARVPQPRRRHRRVPPAHRAGDPADRRPDAGPARRPAQEQGHGPRGHDTGQEAAGEEGLRPGPRRPAAAPHDPARAGGPAVRADPVRHAERRQHRGRRRGEEGVRRGRLLLPRRAQAERGAGRAPGRPRRWQGRRAV
ncbi:MAG: ATP-dependent Clp protease, ATP-binding subunit ClpC, partial [uncultured Frankineae bacterium]